MNTLLIRALDCVDLWALHYCRFYTIKVGSPPLIETHNNHRIASALHCGSGGKYLVSNTLCAAPFLFVFVCCYVSAARKPVGSHCRRPPPRLHPPADVTQGRLVVPAVCLLPFRGFTWEATAQINSLNSHRSVGTSLSFPRSLAHSLSTPPPPCPLLYSFSASLCPSSFNSASLPLSFHR